MRRYSAVAEYDIGVRSTTMKCSVDGCAKPSRSRGWCGMHYDRWRTHGDPLMVTQVRTPAVRFWSYVDKNGPDGYHSQTGENLGPCWLWTAAKSSGGYGRLNVEGRLVQAHRLAYELLTGPIPPELDIDHLCRVHNCVNPDHLEPVTHAENTRRGNGGHLQRAKTHCPQGHEYTPENTRVYQGRRHCRACHRVHDAAYRARRRAA
jgi:hypothetical protein